MRDSTQASSVRTAIIADDHGLVRNALREVIDGIDQVNIVGEADNGLEAITLAKTLRPTLMTLDSGMPLARGMEVFGETRRWSPDTKIAVVTGFTGVGQLADWVAAGVDGLFLKTCEPEEMQTGFSLLLEGGTYYSKAVMSTLQHGAKQHPMTLRERQILHLIAEGCANVEIGERLSISPKTVDNLVCFPESGPLFELVPASDDLLPISGPPGWRIFRVSGA